jgi:adenine-specific DNA-methyltransferase
MNSVGLYLKVAREDLDLPLQEVCQHTKIDVSLLSRIENGKRVPTKEQVLQLAKFYQIEEEGILVHWLTEKLLNEVENKDYGLRALQAAEDMVQYGYSILAFPQIPNLHQINMESRRYIGNKARLRMWLSGILPENTNYYKDCDTFFDVFAGTGCIAKSMFASFKKVIVNDILHSNQAIYKAFFWKTAWNKGKVFSLLDAYNALEVDKLPENYFSTHFGGKFFDEKNAKIIGHIREDLEQKKQEGFLNEKEFCILLATLIYNIDRIANTVGHFDAYIKKPIKYQPLRLRPIQIVDFEGIEIYREDANQLARKVKADIAYIDPPYNSRQYNRFYHIYENLVEWKKPELFGVALKPKPENSSVYCTTKAKNAFQDLVENLDVKYLAVSYNNTYNAKSSSSENKIQLEEIEEILKKKGETKVFECDHPYFNAGKTEFDDHKELLFICNVSGK